MLHKIAQLTRARVPLKFAIDLGLWLAATPLAFLLRLEWELIRYSDDIVALTVIGMPVKALAIYVLRLPWRSWYRVGVRDLVLVLEGVAGVTLVTTALYFFLAPTFQIPRGVPLIEALLAVLLLSGVRLATRVALESYQRHASGGRVKGKKVLIAGAGEAGTMIAREMLRHPEAVHVPIGFLDDDPGKQRNRYMGLQVLGTINAMSDVLATYRVDEVLIAMPSAEGVVVRRVVELARAAGVPHRTIPSIYDIVSGKVSISDIREVDVEDLLRREPVRLELDVIAQYLRGRTVLVTGAGGSIGAEIARQVAVFEPQHLLLLGRGENTIYTIDGELARTHPILSRRAIITDVRDMPSLRAVFERHRPAVVFHAAAHKHVPLMEANPEQAILNNVMGTSNLTDLALEYSVERFVNISTDKAVNPTSVMGAAKRVAEMIVHRASGRCVDGSTFVSVRFGNVLGSRGSVIPLFKQQILSGGPVTVTDPEMKRYFMTIPEAAQLVLQAGSMGMNGSVFVLDMGEPVRILDLARDLILLSGKEPDEDIEIVFTGMRPGEKLFEELLMAEEGTVPSRHEKVFIARMDRLPDATFDSLLQDLIAAAFEYDQGGLRASLRALVPTYTSGEQASSVGQEHDAPALEAA